MMDREIKAATWYCFAKQAWKLNTRGMQVTVDYLDIASNFASDHAEGDHDSMAESSSGSVSEEKGSEGDVEIGGQGH
jgi:hypothetical protein